MLRTAQTIFFTMIINLLSWGILASAEAHVSVNISLVAPAPQEVIVAPTGYVSCYTVPAGISDGVWINTRQICEYSGTPDRSAWIAGYWGCSDYTPTGVCNRWKWRSAHWVRRGNWEYGMRSHKYHPAPSYNRSYGHAYGHSNNGRGGHAGPIVHSGQGNYGGHGEQNGRGIQSGHHK